MGENRLSDTNPAPHDPPIVRACCNTWGMNADRRYSDFAELRSQSVSEMRRVLVNGEPVERAWAGWSLALAIGAAANEDLRNAALESPTPGVRTLLLVILAGHGERRLIEIFAEDDPDEDVRAAACRNLAAMTSGDDHGAESLLTQRLKSDSSAVVRAEILRLVETGRLRVPLLLLEESALDEDLEIRTLAVDVLLDRAAASSVFPAVLEDRAIEEPDPDLCLRLARAWIAAGGSSRLIERLASDQAIDAPKVAAAVQLVFESGSRFPWAVLELLAERDPSIDQGLVALVESTPEPPALSFLLRIAGGRPAHAPARTETAAWRRYWTMSDAAEAAASRLATILPNLEPRGLTTTDMTHVAALAQSLARSLAMSREIELAEDGVDLDAQPPFEQPPYYREGHLLLATCRRLMNGRGVDLA